MTPADRIALAIKANIVLIVFALALTATFEDALYLFRRPGLLARSILSMNVVMPVLAAVAAAVLGAAARGRAHARGARLVAGAADPAQQAGQGRRHGILCDRSPLCRRALCDPARTARRGTGGNRLRQAGPHAARPRCLGRARQHHRSARGRLDRPALRACRGSARGEAVGEICDADPDRCPCADTVRGVAGNGGAGRQRHAPRPGRLHHRRAHRRPSSRRPGAGRPNGPRARHREPAIPGLPWRSQPSISQRKRRPSRSSSGK